MTTGFLSLLLHCHLPFVKHPEHSDCMEERWLFQAITDSYMPLINVFRRLAEDDVPFRVAVSLSPTLLEMLADDYIKQRYKTYLVNLIELAEKEIHRNSSSEQLQRLSVMYRDMFAKSYRDFTETFREDLITPWRELAQEGKVELLTCAATHGYLPLLMQRESIGAQIRAGVDSFRRHLGVHPSGFWLPECAYTPDAELYLKCENIRYFILETHGVLFATPRPKYGYHAPVVTPNGILAFGRDPDCSKQVWSADEGYPGDPAYREFYRDIGYELPQEYLGNALPGNCRVPVGIKYYRVTDRRSDHKDLYCPEAAVNKAREHAANFMFWRNKEAEYWGPVLGRIPIMVAPYDAELFGHWWFEGPVWLESLIRLLASENQGVRLIAPSDYVEYYPVNQVAEPAVSSWGYKGYHEVWLEGSNDWIYRHLHHCQEILCEALRKYRQPRGLRRRALNQAARELLLAQASDWPFIMKAGTVPGYARKRFTTHIGRFLRLMDEIAEGAIDPVFLSTLESRDSIFRDMDLVSYFAA